MPPCLLQFAKIVLRAGQDMPTCIWEPWSIGVAKAIRAHAILLKVLDTMPLLSSHASRWNPYSARAHSRDSSYSYEAWQGKRRYIRPKEVRTMVEFDRSVLGVESAPIRYDVEKGA